MIAIIAGALYTVSDSSEATALAATMGATLDGLREGTDTVQVRLADLQALDAGGLIADRRAQIAALIESAI